MAESRTWVAVAPPDALVALEPLAAAHARRGPARLVPLENPEGWRAAVAGARAVLVVGSADESPASALAGPLVRDEGRPVPVGWLPADARLSDAVRAMAEVATRDPSRGPVVLLAGHEERHRRLLDGIESALGGGSTAYRWDAERASRHTMLRGLRLGPALALYAGHGTPRGWASYGGVSGRDFAGPGEPLGGLVCLTCRAAARPRGGPSFAEEVVLAGGAGAVLATAENVPHEEHVAMAGAIVAALNSGASTLGDSVCHPALPAPTLGLYRIVGDPGAPLAAAVGAADACAQISAPVPGEPIQALPAGWWPQEAIEAARSHPT